MDPGSGIFLAVSQTTCSFCFLYRVLAISTSLLAALCSVHSVPPAGIWHGARMAGHLVPKPDHEIRLHGPPPLVFEFDQISQGSAYLNLLLRLLLDIAIGFSVCRLHASHDKTI